MPAIRAISYTVYLASFTTISFTYDTISSQDADFGFPDLGAFSITLTENQMSFFRLRNMS